MVGRHIKNGLFIFQIAGDDYSKSDIAEITNYCVSFIIGSCRLSAHDIKSRKGIMGTAMVNKTIQKTCVGILIKEESALEKCNKTFNENEEFYLNVNSQGIYQCDNTGEKYVDCLEQVCEMLGIEERKILPKNYPFKEPPVKEKEFTMYRSSGDLRSIMSLYNALEGKTRTLYSNGKGRYGLSVKIFGEDLIYYKSEYMLEMSPFDTKMSPFNEKMAAELSSLYR